MARKRTSLEQQLLAVQSAARILRQKEALEDAAYTLTEMINAQRELNLPEPDPDKVSECMERVFVQ